MKRPGMVDADDWVDGWGIWVVFALLTVAVFCAGGGVGAAGKIPNPPPTHLTKTTVEGTVCIMAERGPDVAITCDWLDGVIVP